MTKLNKIIIALVLLVGVFDKLIAVEVAYIPCASAGLTSFSYKRVDYNNYYGVNTTSTIDGTAQTAFLIEVFGENNFGFTTGLERNYAGVFDAESHKIPLMLTISSSNKHQKCLIGNVGTNLSIRDSDTAPNAVRRLTMNGVINLNYQFKKIRLGLIYEHGFGKISKINSERIITDSPNSFYLVMGYKIVL